MSFKNKRQSQIVGISQCAYFSCDPPSEAVESVLTTELLPSGSSSYIMPSSAHNVYRTVYLTG
jgi:hypothetical protein